MKQTIKCLAVLGLLFLVSLPPLRANEETFRIGGFTDITWTSVLNQSSDHNENDKFTLGGFDMYMTGMLDPKVIWLSEIVFEVGEANESILDIERGFIKYNIHRTFSVAAGRMHTALGYWNNAFHHGTFLQLGTSRPVVYNFEDDEGLLPVHITGLEFSGEIPAQSVTLGYIANVGNGRGVTPDPPQFAGDANPNKASNILLYTNLKAIGLRVGAGYYQDRIPQGEADPLAPDDPVRPGEIQEAVTNIHLYYYRYFGTFAVETIAEAHTIEHAYAEKTFNQDTKISSAYLQTGISIDEEERWIPYFRVETLSTGDVSDSYLGTTADQHISIAVIGLRWNVLENNAIKFEYLDERMKPDSGDTSSLTVFKINSSWGF